MVFRITSLQAPKYSAAVGISLFETIAQNVEQAI